MTDAQSTISASELQPPQEPSAEPNGPGRPRKIDDAVTAKLEEMFRIDATVQEACNQAGIDTATFYRERQRNPEFAAKMARAQEFPFLVMKKVVVKAANEGDGKLALNWLKLRAREQYHEKTEQRVTVERDGASELAEALLGDAKDQEAPPATAPVTERDPGPAL